MTRYTFTHTQHENLVDQKPIVKTFDGKRMYTLDEKIYHSISFVLSLYQDNAGLDEWKNRIGKDVAAKIVRDSTQRGNIFHQICESYLKNECVCQFQNNILEYGMFENIRPELNKIDDIMAIELPMVSKKFKIAGQLDILGYYDGILSMIDLKSARKEKKLEWCNRWFLQETFYCLVVEELFGTPVEQIVTLVATEDGKTQVLVKKKDDFIAELTPMLNDFSENHTKCGCCSNV